MSGQKIITGLKEAIELAKSAPPIHSPTGCWQDFDQQIPAVNAGDPIAVMELEIGGIMTAPDLDSRPHLCREPEDK